MPIDITMPRLSDTMEEGTLVKWRVQVGDEVSAGDHLADVETDKATMELQAFDDGTIAKLAVEEGETVPVGALIVTLAGEGESVEDAAAQSGQSVGEAREKAERAEDAERTAQVTEAEDEQATRPEAAQAPETDEAPTTGTVTATQAPPTAGRVRVSPLARKLADEHGLDLTQIKGTGPDGRIIKRDVLAAAEAGKAPAAEEKAPAPGPGPAPAPAAKLEEKKIPVSSMRKTIAKRLVESKTTIPHFTVSMPIDMDPLLDLRKTLNQQLEAQGIKLSVNDFLVRAAALACIQHPAVNSSWQDEHIQQHGTVNVGVAVALPEERGGGLIVPVLRDVQHMGLRQISEQTKQLANKARDQGLSQEEMQGGTFTISNLGMFGVEHFEAIINPPQAAILAVGTAVEKPVVRASASGGSEITVGHEMTATISADHRVVDGAIAAAYLQTLKELLENPAGLLV